MASVDLTFLGTGNAFAPGGLCWNGFLLDGRHMFEAPPQALQSLNRLEVDPNSIETVVLSHQHGDHFLGLPFLLLHWEHMGRTAPIRIIAPLGTRESMLRACELAFPDVTAGQYGIEWVDAEAGRSVGAGGMTIEPVEVNHDPKLERCLGYHVQYGGRRLGYTGDSTLCDGVLDLAREAEVLVSECASRDMKLPVHMNLVDDIPVLRGAMQVTSELVLTHLGPNIDTNGLPHTRVAEDLTRYAL